MWLPLPLLGSKQRVDKLCKWPRAIIDIWVQSGIEPKCHGTASVHDGLSSIRSRLVTATVAIQSKQGGGTKLGEFF